MKRLLTVCWVVALAGAAQAEAEWITLFNGKNLEGWMSSEGRAPGANWVVEDGTLKRTGPAGYIWTRERFGDFELDLEYQTEGNSGVFVRTDNPRDPVQTGIEVQIHTPGGPDKHSVGAVYDLQAPSRNAAKPGWNRLRITARGGRIQVELNGEGIVDMDLDRRTARVELGGVVDQVPHRALHGRSWRDDLGRVRVHGDLSLGPAACTGGHRLGDRGQGHRFRFAVGALAASQRQHLVDQSRQFPGLSAQIGEHPGAHVGVELLEPFQETDVGSQ